jgi:hypothetical protein
VHPIRTTETDAGSLRQVVRIDGEIDPMHPMRALEVHGVKLEASPREQPQAASAG